MVGSIPALGHPKQVDLEASLESDRRLQVAIGLVGQDVDHIHRLRVGQRHHAVPEIALVGDMRVDIALSLGAVRSQLPAAENSFGGKPGEVQSAYMSCK